MTTTVPTRLVSVEEYERIPDPPGMRSELVRGRITAMVLPGKRHAKVARRTASRLGDFADENGLGDVMDATGYILERGPDTVRGPDVSFVRADRLGDDDATWHEGAPTLAVEVVSPGQTRAEVAAKVREYLAAGAERVWEVRPKEATVTVHRPGAEPVTHGAGDVLTSDDAGFDVDGFALDVASLFA